MGEDPSTDARLSEIHRDVRALGDKVDRLLIGRPASEGLISRVTRLEERQGGLRAAVAWLFALLCAGLGVVGYRQH